MSTFGTLNIGRTALTAAQRALDVTAHNIANAETPGYSRQRLNLTAIDPALGVSKFAAYSKGQSGYGVEILTVDQVRNPFLDKQFYKENSMLNEWESRLDGLSYIEKLFDELSNTGLSKVMNDFVTSIQEVSKNPVNKEVRTNMMQNALKMTETVHHYATQLNDKMIDLNNTTNVLTGYINDIADTISEINIQIERYELSGQKANDLRDKRAYLLDQLSGYTGIVTSEDNSGHLKVVMTGTPPYTLIDHSTTYDLIAVQDTANPITGTPNEIYTIHSAIDGSVIYPGGGSLKANMDLRDGATSNNMGIPYMNSQLNRFVNAMATEFNNIHMGNWTMMDSSSGLPSQTGIPFFTDTTGGTTGLNSINFTVNPAIVSNSYNIALSDSQILSDVDKNNNLGALKLINLFNSSSLSGIGGFYSFVESFIGEISVEVSQAETRLEGQQTLVGSIETQRQSVSGVSLDEEMTNMMKFQHSYTAAARLITAVDEMIDVIVNRLGAVGR